MSNEEDKTVEQEEDAAWVEATKGEKGEKPEEQFGEKEEVAEDEKKPKEKKDEKKEGEEEPDWKAEAEKAKANLDLKAKEADMNKRFADDMARQKADADRKLAEAEAQRKKEAEEATPEEVQAFIDEYPEAERAIEHFSKKAITKAMEVYNAELKEACGGQDPVEFIKEVIWRTKQNDYERIVGFGYWDDKTGKYIKGHPDLYEITKSQEFNEFVRQELKTNPSFNENDPYEGIRFINNFKQVQLEKAGKKDKEKLNKTKEEMEEQMTATVGEGVRGRKSREPDPNDEEAAWRDALKET